MLPRRAAASKTRTALSGGSFIGTSGRFSFPNDGPEIISFAPDARATDDAEVPFPETAMHFDLDQAPLNLARGALLKIRDAGGQSFRVVQGRVWVTQEGSLDDVFLDAGSRFTFDGAGASVVTAEGPRDAVATLVFDGPLTIRSR